jgi:hypothetical protein
MKRKLLLAFQALAVLSTTRCEVDRLNKAFPSPVLEKLAQTTRPDPAAPSTGSGQRCRGKVVALETFEVKFGSLTSFTGLVTELMVDLPVSRWSPRRAWWLVERRSWRAAREAQQGEREIKVVQVSWVRGLFARSTEGIGTRADVRHFIA